MSSTLSANPNGHSPAAINVSGLSGVCLTTAGFPTTDEQSERLFCCNLKYRSNSMWFSSPNKPIVFSDSILQTSYVKVIPSVGSRTNPIVVLSEVSAFNLLLPDACLCTEYLPSESSVSAPRPAA